MTLIVNGYKYQGVKKYEDRHGKRRYYLRANGHPLPDPKDGWRLFDKRYHEAKALALTGRKPAPARPDTSAHDTIEKVLRAYFDSDPFKKLAPDTQRTRKSLLGNWAKDVGGYRISTLKTSDIEQGMKNRIDKPNTANNWLAVVRDLLKWCIAAGSYGVTTNAAVGVERLEVPETDGYTAWTEANVEQFIRRWPKGTMEYRALMVLLWSGQRRGDVVTFGWHKFDGDMIVFTQAKTQKKMTLPISPSLAEILPPRDNVVGFDGKPKPFLTITTGKPFSPAYFTGWFHNACMEAGLDLSPHGTRKLAARRMYRNIVRAGRDNPIPLVMAFTGHQTEKQLRIYLGKDFEQEQFASELGAYMA